MKDTLVIGASTNTSRYSFKAAVSLKSKGHKVYLYGLRKGFIDNLEISTNQQYIENINTITLYVGPQNQPSIYNYVIELKPKRVIFNPGTENPEFYDLLKKANIPFTEACTLVLLSIGDY